MSTIKITLIVSLLCVLGIILAATFYVEFGLIPQALYKSGYQGAVIIHVVVTLVMLAITAILSAWLSSRTIYKVQEKLVASHLNHLLGAIGNVVSGAWSNQAAVEKTVFMAGARLGYDVRDNIPPVSRGDVVAGLDQMALPSPKKLLGDSSNVVDEMGAFMSDLDRRKERLS
ncbi:MAG: hypothetical protein L6R45_10435 [Anaerolineae bacterium]|nr:hypothetical protein [Anaerolineae bacterium]